jgi:hypothetical protein
MGGDVTTSRRTGTRIQVQAGRVRQKLLQRGESFQEVQVFKEFLKINAIIYKYKEIAVAIFTVVVET